MKKITTFFLVFIISVLLLACGNSDVKTSGVTPTVTESGTVTEDAQATETPENLPTADSKEETTETSPTGSKVTEEPIDSLTKTPTVTTNNPNVTDPVKATGTPKATVSAKATGTPKATSTPKATKTPKATATPKPTATSKPISTTKPTATPIITKKPTATSTPKPTKTPTPTKFTVTGEVGFQVSGTKLLDANGNEFVMRGVNHAHAWFRDYDATAIKAIATTGSNTVRIVCSDGQQYTKDTVSSLKTVINLCKSYDLVVVLEVHDITGNNSTSALEKTANFWISVKDALIGNEDYVILNIANEWMGSWDDWTWRKGYTSVIPKIRAAGICNTIMVDAAGWGQYGQSIINYGKDVFNSDPLGNTMFSVHMYGTAGKDEYTIRNNIAGATNKGLCIIVGEFGYTHSDGDVNEEFIMQYCVENNIGYLGWSWKGNGGGVEYLDIAKNWDGSVLSSDWGENLINGTYGIRNNSEICSVY